MSDMGEWALPDDVNERLDAMLAGWAAANALPAPQVAAIRQRVLAAEEPGGTGVSVEWWQSFAGNLSGIIRRSTWSLQHTRLTAVA